MPHIYKDARMLDGQEKIADMECVTLVKAYTNAGPARFWHEGEKVIGNQNIAIGTAIATFVDGKWPGLAHGNHSGFFMGQVSNGIYILDQWPNPNKKKISKRFIYRRGKDKDGNYIHPTENADAFSIIK